MKEIIIRDIEVLGYDATKEVHYYSSCYEIPKKYRNVERYMIRLPEGNYDSEFYENPKFWPFIDWGCVFNRGSEIPPHPFIIQHLSIPNHVPSFILNTPRLACQVSEETYLGILDCEDRKKDMWRPIHRVMSGREIDKLFKVIMEEREMYLMGQPDISDWIQVILTYNRLEPRHLIELLEWDPGRKALISSPTPFLLGQRWEEIDKSILGMEALGTLSIVLNELDGGWTRYEQGVEGEIISQYLCYPKVNGIQEIPDPRFWNKFSVSTSRLDMFRELALLRQCNNNFVIYQVTGIAHVTGSGLGEDSVGIQVSGIKEIKEVMLWRMNT